MAQSDPDGAMKLAQQLPTLQRRSGAVMSVIMQIAQNDPDKALAQAQQLPAGMVRDQAMSSALSGIAEKDPARAMSVLQSMKGSQNRFGGAFSIFNQWADRTSMRPRRRHCS